MPDCIVERQADTGCIWLGRANPAAHREARCPLHDQHSKECGALQVWMGSRLREVQSQRENEPGVMQPRASRDQCCALMNAAEDLGIPTVVTALLGNAVEQAQDELW